MCLRFRTIERWSRRIALAALCCAQVACNTPVSETTVPNAPPEATIAQGTPAPTLFPGNGAAPPESPLAARYANDDHARAEGARLFDWYNCSGCHFHGAGGIGPSLMDDDWTYGGSMEQIYSTIHQGRPNGMPSWGGKLSSTQIWEIAAYVHGLPGSNPAGAASEPTAPLPAVRDGDAVSPDQAAPAPAATDVPVR